MNFNCLFDALGAYTRYNGYQMRDIICNHLARNPVLGEGGIRASYITQWDADDLESYVEHMRDPMTWGGETEILTFANLFHSRVYVHMQGAKPLVYTPLRDHKHTIHVHYTGNHYEILGRS